MTNSTEKIIVIAPKAPPIGGIATWFDIFINNLPQSISVFHINSSVSLERQNANRIKKLFLKYKEYRREKRILLETLKNNSINVVYIATSGRMGFIRDKSFAKIAHKYSAKVIVHMHFGRIPDILNNNSFESNLLKKVCRISDGIVAIDRPTYDSLRQLGFNVIYIANPINENEYSYKNDSKQICFVGTLNNAKGIRELYDASLNITKSHPDWRVKIIGPNDREEEILNIISSNKCENIVFTGPLSRDKIYCELKESSFLVLPSYTEGMPYSLLEAMSFGIPCLATNVGAIPHLLDGCGVVIKPRDVAELEKGMEKIINDNDFRAILSRASYEKICKEYNSKERINEIVEYWRSL